MVTLIENNGLSPYRRKELLRKKAEYAKEAAERAAEKDSLEYNRTLALQELKNKPDYAKQNWDTKTKQERLNFDRQKESFDVSQKKLELQKANNLTESTSIDPTTGEPKVDYQKLTKLNMLLEKNYDQKNSGGQNGNPFSRFQTESPEKQAEILAKYKARKNEWGDDLTKSAPTATTEYKDGKRVWSYPGSTDPKTGEVKGSMTITSPYANEKEYQNKGGVVGQREDGSWIWDKNVKAGSGGGFFQRGGLSDLGRALAGDAPRQIAQTAKPNDNVDESNRLNPVFQREQLKTLVPINQGMTSKSGLERIKKEQPFLQKQIFQDLENNSLPSFNANRKRAVNIVAEGNKLMPSLGNTQSINRNNVTQDYLKLKDRLNNKYNLSQRVNRVNDLTNLNTLFGNPKVGTLTDDEFNKTTKKINSYMSNWRK